MQSAVALIWLTFPGSGCSDLAVFSPQSYSRFSTPIVLLPALTAGPKNKLAGSAQRCVPPAQASQLCFLPLAPSVPTQGETVASVSSHQWHPPLPVHQQFVTVTPGVTWDFVLSYPESSFQDAIGVNQPPRSVPWEWQSQELRST